MFDGIAKFSSQPIFPYLCYYELNNSEGQKADDTEIESEITIRIDLYGTSSLSTIAERVDRIMKSLDFARNYFNDQDETLETGETIKHKIGSYTGNFQI
jgi:predicted double-glycine peptidase